MVGVAAAATLPFLWKPLHIDDPADLQYVQQILRDPSDPYGFEFDWGEGPRPAIYNYHPPLKFYYHALVLWLANAGTDVYRYPHIEFVLHASYVPFVLVIVFSLARLAEHFRAPPIVTAAFWCLGPGFLPGQNAMLDVPTLALGLGGTACLVRLFERGGRGWTALTAGCLLAAAVLTKYAAVVFALAWAVWMGMRRVRFPVWLQVFLPPALAILVWSGWSWYAYGFLHPLVVINGVPGQVGARRPDLTTAIDSIVFLGGAVPGMLLYCLLGSSRGLAMALLGLVSALVLYVVRDPKLYVVEGRVELPPEGLVWWIWLAASGAICLFVAAGSVAVGVRNSDRRGQQRAMLGIWAVLALLLGAASAPFVAMRRVLDSAAAASLLVFSEDRSTQGAVPRRRKVALALALIVNISVGYAVALSDYVFARIYPEFAAFIASQQPHFQHKAWCYGYWGWMYYAQRYGLKRYIPGREEPQTGDMFVWPDTVAKPAVVPEELMARLRKIFQEYHDSLVPARLMSKQAGAGYYSNAWGPLPYTWARLPLEVLNAAVVGPPPEQQPTEPHASTVSPPEQ